jgi:hypothetical protein
MPSAAKKLEYAYGVMVRVGVAIKINFYPVAILCF